mmetsp:Transcript_10177/g.21454  ORF Transcript_10177/g.21454 Transcript_10177/m.21454 type:complete len:292 (-) Transcript_10177:159-1034(-)
MQLHQARPGCNSFTSLLLGRGRVDDVEELSLERCTADETAVDVGLLEQVGRVGTLHRAAVDDARLRRDLGRHIRRQPLAEGLVDLLRLLRRRGAAGADGPHRLVRDHDLGPVVLRELVGERRELLVTDLEGLARVALLELLANACHHRQPARHRHLGLERDQLRALPRHAEALAPFTVAHDDPRRADVLQHGRAGLARARAVREEADVLSAHRDVLSDGARHNRHVQKWRRDHDLDVGRDGSTLAEGAHQFVDRRDVAVALPVPAEDVLARACRGLLPWESDAQEAAVRAA